MLFNIFLMKFFLKVLREVQKHCHKSSQEKLLLAWKIMKNFMKMKYEVDLEAQIKFRCGGRGRTTSPRAQSSWQVVSAVGSERAAQDCLLERMAASQLWQSTSMFMCRGNLLRSGTKMRASLKL